MSLLAELRESVDKRLVELSEALIEDGEKPIRHESSRAMIEFLERNRVTVRPSIFSRNGSIFIEWDNSYRFPQGGGRRPIIDTADCRQIAITFLPGKYVIGLMTELGNVYRYIDTIEKVEAIISVCDLEWLYVTPKRVASGQEED